MEKESSEIVSMRKFMERFELRMFSDDRKKRFSPHIMNTSLESMKSFGENYSKGMK